MKSRREFIRNSFMAIAISLLPKPLLPQEVEVAEVGNKLRDNLFTMKGGRVYAIDNNDCIWDLGEAKQAEWMHKPVSSYTFKLSFTYDSEILKKLKNNHE